MQSKSIWQPPTSEGRARDVSVLQNDCVWLGDANLDGVVDMCEIAPLVNLITTGTLQVEADVNRDGWVTGLNARRLMWPKRVDPARDRLLPVRQETVV